MFIIHALNVEIQSFKVFDRWGNEIVNQEGNEVAWNGKNADGVNFSQGSYTFLLSYEIPADGELKMQHGSIFLIE